VNSQLGGRNAQTIEAILLCCRCHVDRSGGDVRGDCRDDLAGAIDRDVNDALGHLHVQAARVALAGPGGDWLCVAPDPEEHSGTLHMTQSRYVFTGAGMPTPASGSYTIDKNIVHLGSERVSDELMVLGYFNPGANPAVLVFNSGAGRGLTCRRA
jgi:hypothetical protein